MIKKRLEVGTSTIYNRVLKKELPIKLYIIVYDVAPQDWKPPVDPKTGKPPIDPKTGKPFPVVPPQTIGELKQRWGSSFQATFCHLFSREEEKFQFDFSPWAHLPDDTYLEIEWRFDDGTENPACRVPSQD